MNKQRLCTIGLSVTLGLSNLAIADNLAPMVPSNGNLGMFYYQVGGGNDTPMPAFLDTQTLPLNVSSNIGLGYNCGVFNPSLSIANAMNGIQNSAINIEQSIINNATGAIYDMPLYLLSRANHTAYDILTNQFFNAQNQLNVSTKSCEVMQGEMANGQNPYSNWATIAMGDDWEKHMSLSSESASEFGGESGQDINQVKTQVDQDNGSNGVPWIHHANASGGGDNAGGSQQPAIEVIHDTVVAGYNVLLQANRNYDDTSMPTQNTQDAYLVSVWASPLLAADWVVNVVGDQEITTYAGGPKQSTPGVGLLSDVYARTTTIQQGLVNLIDGATPETLHNLQALASPSMVLNSQAIEAFRELDPVDQSIYVHKLAQAMAAEIVAEQVRLAKQLLMVGESVPEIQGNKAARKTIQEAMARLDEYRNNLTFGGPNPIVGSAAKVVEGVITLATQKAAQNSAIQPSSAAGAELTNGAMMSGGG